MTNNNWIEEQVKNEMENNIQTFVTPTSHVNFIGIVNFISNLITQKDKEHKAELEMIRAELQSEKLGYEHDRNANTGSYGKTVAGVQLDTMEQAISILDKHINK